VRGGGAQGCGPIKGGGRRGSWGCAPVVIPAGIAARPLQRGENGEGGADWWGHGVSGTGASAALASGTGRSGGRGARDAGDAGLLRGRGLG